MLILATNLFILKQFTDYGCLNQLGKTLERSVLMERVQQYNVVARWKK
jgi:hypothetical protein